MTIYYLPMQWSSKSKKSCGVGKIWVGEGRADEICAVRNCESDRKAERNSLLTGSVSRCVASFMITVNGDIQTEVFSQVVVVAISKKFGVISYKTTQKLIDTHTCINHITDRRGLDPCQWLVCRFQGGKHCGRFGQPEREAGQ